MEAGEGQPSREVTPQDGSIRALRSHRYLHDVLDWWLEKAVKPHLEGEAYGIRYLHDFVVCFEHQRDAQRFDAVLSRRLSQFPLELEPTKTRWIAFGRLAPRDAQRQGHKQPETLDFLGFSHYGMRNRQGGFKMGRRAEKSRVQRTIHHLQDTIRRIRHDPLEDQGVKSLIHSSRGTMTTLG